MPILSFVFVFTFLILQAVPSSFEALAYLRQSVLNYEWWRLLSQSFVHLNWEHVFRDCAAFLCFAPLVEVRLGAARFLSFFALASISISLAYLGLRPEVEGLLGVSGVVSGLFGVLLAQELPKAWRANSYIWFSVELLLLLGFAIKLGYEVYFQSSFFYKSQLGAAPLAHFAGFLSGIVAGTIFKAKSVPVSRHIIFIGIFGATLWLSAVLFWPK